MKTLSDLPLQGKRLLLRVDFNVPEGDDTRIREALPSIEYALQHGARLILMSHFGRPNGKPDPQLSLAPVAKRLAALLKRDVPLAPDCVGPAVEALIAKLQPGQLLLLENLRFHPEEEKPTPAFTAALARLGDLYCDDAFGCAHRAHASIMLATQFRGRSAAGFLMAREIAAFQPLLHNPKRPFHAILGGGKVDTKKGLIAGLSQKADALFLGGALCFQPGGIPPTDLTLSKGVEIQVIPYTTTPPSGWQVSDIGPATVPAWSLKLKTAATIFWNGPLGIFEKPPFDRGTRALAQFLATLKGATTIIGGGDTVAAIHQAGCASHFTHLSTGGGASLEFLEHGHLPGIDCLTCE